MAISIRRVGAEDIAPLRLISFRCTPGPGDASAVEAAICGLTAEELEGCGGALMVAQDGHLVVAVAVAMPTPGDLSSWYIPMLAVRGPWQGQGLGRRLKLECLKVAWEAGARKVISSVHVATARMHRINQLTPGAEWDAEESGPGVFYSIDLEAWAASEDPDPQLPLELPPS